MLLFYGLGRQGWDSTQSLLFYLWLRNTERVQKASQLASEQLWKYLWSSVSVIFIIINYVMIKWNKWLENQKLQERGLGHETSFEMKFGVRENPEGEKNPTLFITDTAGIWTLKCNYSSKMSMREDSDFGRCRTSK